MLHIGIYSKKFKTYVHIKTYTGDFLAVLYILIKTGTDPNTNTMTNK